MEDLVQHLEAAGLKPLVLDEPPSRRMTNTEFITNLMEHCPYGIMSQIIVIQATQQFAEQIAQTPLEELDEHPLISGEAFKRGAEWVLEQYKQQYGG